jgi:hypothetical protein
LVPPWRGGWLIPNGNHSLPGFGHSLPSLWRRETYCLRACAPDGQFAGWTFAERDKKVSRLASIIKTHAKFGVHLIVSHSDYVSKIKGRFHKRYNDPYVAGAYIFMQSALRFFQKNNISEPVDFIFDEQFKKSDQMLAIYSDFISVVPDEYKSLIGSRPDHRNDKTFRPLQAADMLAWHIRREQAEPEDKRIATAAIEIFDVPHQRFVLDVDFLAETLGG